MRRPTPVWLAALAGVAVPLAGGEPPLPAHPRQIAASQVRVELPRVAGKRYQLHGGSVAWVVADPTLPLVEVAVAVRAGSFLDPPGRTGLTSLATGLLRTGGAGRWSADEVDRRADELGARLASRGGVLRSGVSLSVPSWSLTEGLDLLFAMLAEPRFAADRLATTLDALRESMARRNQDPLAVLEREWEWLMLGRDHFSTLPVTPASLGGVTSGELAEHHHRSWRPAGLLFAVSGEVDPAAVAGELDRRLRAWTAAAPAAAEPSSTAWPPPPPRAPEGGGGLFHAPFDGAQAQVALGHRAPRRPDWTARERAALALATEILGGSGAISRLAGRLRTAEGLVYRAGAIYRPGELWPGELQLFFDTAPAAVPRAVDAAISELERLRVEPVRPQELEVARTTLVSQLRLAFDTAEETAGYFAEDELLGRPHEVWQARLEQLRELTAAEVQAAARDYFLPDRLTVLVVGRWPAVAGAERDGLTDLERVSGHRVVHLPVRDPLTLEAVGDQR